MTQAIELDDVTKSFRSQVAVNRLSLSVPQGCIYGFIGPNGSGKTTTLRMILRIYQPDSGRAVVLGEAFGRVADDRIGYLPEERGLYKRMKVFDLIAYYARLKGMRDSKSKIHYWLDRMGATEWGNKKVDALSKGMAQKVQFISAVVHQPQLLILDEPFSGLDPVNMEVLREAVLELRRQGTTIVFSTHDMDMAEQLCDYVFMIYRGNKVLDGTLDNIQSAYPADRVRVKLSDANLELKVHPWIQQPQRIGRNIEFRIPSPDVAHQLLRELSSTYPVDYFELVRPSLHDIFVQIAGPEARQAILADSGETAA